MKRLDKYGIFKACGFNVTTGDMPNLLFYGYDKALEMCYKSGRDAAYIEAFADNSEIPELHKRIKDLEISNARLLERNHQLKVDNEESLKEVEELQEEVKTYSKLCNDLRKANVEHSNLYLRDKQALAEMSIALSKQENVIEDLSKANVDIARDALNTSPKSKFVITVEEF